MNAWARFGRPSGAQAAKRSDHPHSARRTRECGSPPGETETALRDSLAWLADATRSETAQVDVEAARHRLTARLAEGMAAQPRNPEARNAGRLLMAPRCTPRAWWPALATGVVLLCVGWLVARSRLMSPAPPAVRLQQVRFDPSLWDLDSITATPTQSEASDMTRLLKR